MFSPTAHQKPPRAAVPSLVKFPRYRPGNGWYLVVDPAGRYSIREDDGAVLGDHGEIPALIVGLTTVFLCAAGVAACAWSAEWVVPFFLLGGFGGVIIGLLLGTAVTAVASCEAEPGVDVHRVESTDPLAWRLCELVAQLGRTKSWIGGTIDHQRLAPSILWTAVGRAQIVDRRYPHFRTALHQESFPATTGETLMAMAGEQASLAAVEANLRQVLRAAIGIDRRQEGHLHDVSAAMSAAMSAAGDSDIAADRSAGLAAEAEWLIAH